MSVSLETGLDVAHLIRRISFVHPAIPTTLSLRDDMRPDAGLDYSLIVRVWVLESDTGHPIAITHTIQMPELDGEQQYLCWIRAAVRGVWLHEVDETMHVDGERRWDPHPCYPNSDVPMAESKLDFTGWSPEAPSGTDIYPLAKALHDAIAAAPKEEREHHEQTATYVVVSGEMPP